MVHIEEGGAPGNVPLIYYDKDGNRKVVGEATVALRQGQLRVVGVFNATPEATYISALNLGGFSIGEPPEDVSDVRKEGSPSVPPSDPQVGSTFQRYIQGRLNEPS